MSKWELWVSRILVIVACALLVYSFVSVETPATVIRGKDITRNEDGPRLVFMVIDALRLGFLTDEDSPMNFTRSSISSKSASVFNAYARMPTVTLPRITAYITGTLPSFGTVLTNLATDEIKIDNWVSRMTAAGRKVDFFGDDTWIRLLPGQFRESEGVTSFFVNDYTEVDTNVTRHLEEELASDAWDALVLHYLGLDHIGHSLGGTSARIPEKLREMDTVVRRIYERLREKNKETYLIVCGDHGMTAAGSHGGASREETRVPVIIWGINGKSRTEDSHSLLEEKMPKIEQIDVSASIFDLFGFEAPDESYGISLFRRKNREDENRLLGRQHEHFRRLVKEKRLIVSDICDDCDLNDNFIRTALSKWFREVQQELIGRSSDVPNGSIAVCVVLLVVAAVLSAEKLIQIDLSILLINLICFASSLIEEEHEIWYFLVSSALSVRFIMEIRAKRRHRLVDLVLLAVLHRIALGFVQSTRRRWSMDPKLLPSPVFSDVLDFDVKDLNEILGKHPVIVTAMSLALWMIFSGESSRSIIIFPFLSHFLRNIELVVADAYYLFVFRICILPISFLFSGQLTSGMVSLVLSVVPSSQLSLLLVIYQIGSLSSKLNTGNAENVMIMMATFFYTGNSNSLSTLSLTSAYLGLLDYNPILVGIQLILNTFAGPIVFLCARETNTFVKLHLPFRISSLATSLVCLYIFQHHLFVWSVYSPKVVYDMAHVLFSVII